MWRSEWGKDMETGGVGNIVEKLNINVNKRERISKTEDEGQRLMKMNYTWETSAGGKSH